LAADTNVKIIKLTIPPYWHHTKIIKHLSYFHIGSDIKTEISSDYC
jgi:hypothetical protein